MKKNKKAIFYSITILIFTIFILVAALTATLKKTSHEKKLGEEQIELIKKYQEGESTLFYVDQSTKYSIYEALYSFAKNGAYFNAPICNPNSESDIDYVMWEGIVQEEDKKCYPAERDVTINFALFLNNQLNNYLRAYTPIIIPEDNYDIIFNEKEEGTEIIGIATQNIIISTEDSNYSIKPSFRTKIPYKLLSRFDEYSTKSQQIKNNIQDCLAKGSHTPDDKEDLLTCSDINKLKKEIEGIENYQITPVVFPEEYTLLFDIEDPSLKNPYSDEKLEIKFGIRFLDTFHPPATEITGTEDRTAQGKTTKYLTWYKNNASDVENYEIYYDEIIESPLTGAKTKKPNSVNQMEIIKPIETEEIGKEIAWKIDYEHTDLENGKRYYFYIRAKDNAGNFAEDIDIEPVELTV